jgi:aminoglycoside phosphotransferase (APT) family kinase protein
MGSRAAQRLDPQDWEGHPALDAWGALGGAAPCTVLVVKEESGSERLSRIYRLEGVASGGRAVIAKRSTAESIAVERKIYDEVLAPLPVDALGCLGSVPDADPRFAWLFLQAAEGVEFDADLPAHRTAAAGWLAGLHLGTEDHAALSGLPDRGAAYFLEHLHAGRRRIAESFENPAFCAADRELLDAILRRLDVVESHWSTVEEDCDRSPQVLVHGDFAARNGRVEGDGVGTRVWVFDWEVAGRGVPGVDLVRADPEVYAAAVAERWPGLDVRAQARLGGLLRGCLAPIGWETLALDTPWVEKPLYGLASYLRRLETFLATSGWASGGPRPRPRAIEAPGSGGDPREHPAARAWRRLGRADDGITRVDALRQKKSAQVYRLTGVGPSGSVVAKRTSHAIGAIERCVYEQALPRLPLRGLRLEGVIEEAEACWLFLEDAGSERAEGPEARPLLSAWLAALHTSAAEIAATLPLPDRGAGSHREHLHAARRPLRENLGNPSLSPADRWVLCELAEGLARLDARWGELEALCAQMPRTLVHGDLGPANLHRRQSAEGDELLVLDWETAGIGPLAVDLLAVDPELYAAHVARTWPEVTPDVVRRWQRCGRLLRTIIATGWESADLAYPWVEKPMVRLRVYRRELEEALSALEPAATALEVRS